jgi:diacylglycerol kinase family enzyme
LADDIGERCVTATPVRLAVVCNPTTVDDGPALRRTVEQRWPGAELYWLETTTDDSGAGQAALARDKGAELVLVCGGDGTVAECAGALAGSGMPLALIPVGTGNLLVRNLGLPLDVPAALDVAAGAGRERIDLLEAGSHRFAVMAGLGFDAAMIRETNDEAKARIGWLAYVAGAWSGLRRSRPVRCSIVVDDAEPVRVRALSVLVCNVGRLQAGMAVVPDADPRDGLLDVITLAPRSWRDTAGLVLRLVGRRIEQSPRAYTARGRTVTVRADRPLPLEFDGDYSGEVRELAVTVLAQALLVCTA